MVRYTKVWWVCVCVYINIGELVQNCKEGFGVQIKADGSILRGYFVGNKLHGVGVMILEKGRP